MHFLSIMTRGRAGQWLLRRPLKLEKSVRKVIHIKTVFGLIGTLCKDVWLWILIFDNFWPLKSPEIISRTELIKRIKSRSGFGSNRSFEKGAWTPIRGHKFITHKFAAGDRETTQKFRSWPWKTPEKKQDRERITRTRKSKSSAAARQLVSWILFPQKSGKFYRFIRIKSNLAPYSRPPSRL